MLALPPAGNGTSKMALPPAGIELLFKNSMAEFGIQTATRYCTCVTIENVVNSRS